MKKYDIKTAVRNAAIGLLTTLSFYSAALGNTNLHANNQEKASLETVLQDTKSTNNRQRNEHSPKNLIHLYQENRLRSDYNRQLDIYLEQLIKSKEDMSERVPLKWVNIFPESMMGGVLGFTYVGDNSMGRRADLVGSTARMVDIHESIHTPDEYETRVLTSLIMKKVRTKYIK